MSTRELILLSPYRLPTQNTLYLGDEEVSAFLNGYAALWHPAALAGAAGPPRIGSPYDFEEPVAGHIYAVPDNPPLSLPGDWEERASTAGARVVRATTDRATTLANLVHALEGATEGDASLLSLPPERIAPFLGLGFGHLQVEALFEASSHDNILSGSDFWHDICAAVAALPGGDPEAVKPHLQSAAERLLAAREVIYPVTIHVVDMALADPEHLDVPWPAALERGQPLNVIASGQLLERLGQEAPARLDALRERVGAGQAEVCGGCYLEREEVLLPLESQMWNLRKGIERTRQLVGQDVRVFAPRRFGFHPQLPLWLQHHGISRVLLVAFDDAVLPAHRTTVVSWPSPDGKQVEAFTRVPHAADSPQTYFHLAYHLHQTIMQDHSATLPLLHRDKPAPPWYADWLELTQLAPVLGRWTTLSKYLEDVLPGDYPSASSADEFHGEYLVERAPRTDVYSSDGDVKAPLPPRSEHPITAFAHYTRLRRRLDTCLTLAALHRGLARADAFPDAASALKDLEDRVESGAAGAVEELAGVLDKVGDALARRLVARGTEGRPGFLVLNPCSFKRRVALELPASSGLAPGGPVKAHQVDGDTIRAVVEVPALGFAWVARTDAASRPGPAASHKLRMADDRCVRNEFLEAEVDPQTGGLKAIRDMRMRVPRLGQQLVFNPGSTMRAKELRITSAGPALGEIISQGVLLDTQDEVLATFRQRFRAWLGRPVLEMRIEIFPAKPPEGYPWHAYYAARFAWREERSALLRGVNGLASITSHSRPETPDFLEVRMGRSNVVVFPGGLPFHQRHGGRMLDVLLVCPGETAQTFDLTIGLDRDYPIQTAVGMVTPAPVVPVDRGPPHVGQDGWLFHLDAPNLLLGGLRLATPAGDSDASAAAAITARLLECAGVGTGAAELRCVRDPVRATLINGQGVFIADAHTRSDAVILDAAPNDLLQVRIDFA
jgi:alpha-mannosidase